MPSEDYSRAPTCSAAWFGEGRQTEDEPLVTKKKTMKTATENKREGLLSRSELTVTSLETGFGKCGKPQLELGLTTRKSALRPAHPYRLRAGDFVLYEKRICPVLRVSDCCAVIAMMQPSREFTTVFGKQVWIKPRPNLVRIGSNSEIPLLKRRAGGPK